jgi:hypothetical protein
MKLQACYLGKNMHYIFYFSCFNIKVEKFTLFLFRGSASCCSHFIMVIVRTVPRNCCSRCLSILTIFYRYMFRPSLAIIKWYIQYFGKLPLSQRIRCINKYLEQLLRVTVLITLISLPYFIMNIKSTPNLILVVLQIICSVIKKTRWSESAGKLYRPSDRRLSAK